MPVAAENVRCLIIFKLPEKRELRFEDMMQLVRAELAKYGTLRRLYKNGATTELYITGTADEQLTSAIMNAVKGARWEVVTDIVLIKKLVPAEFQFVQ